MVVAWAHRQSCSSSGGSPCSSASMLQASAISVRSSRSTASALRRRFYSMVCNRLEVICHEYLDILAAPWIVPFVATSLAQSKERYSSKIGEARLMIGNCIRMMCRSPKSRAGCHFSAAIGLRFQLEGYVPAVPDFALDQHTLEGRKLKRGLTHFREDGARLIPEPTEPDLYIEEAYRFWQIKAQGK